MVRVRCVVPVLLLAAVITSSSLEAKATRPPRSLQKVGDHWTPYNPPDPASFPAGSKVHVIARGDTLWALASKYFGSPYLWPQLWEANTYITDAHWIYPGDPLLITGEATTGEVSTSANLSMGAGSGSSSGSGSGSGSGADGTPSASADLTAGLGAPLPLGNEQDLLCWGYLGDPDEPMPNSVEAFEDSETKLVQSPMVKTSIGVATDEIVFIEGGTATGIRAGETYLVVKPEKLIYLPKSSKSKKSLVGRHYGFRGQIRILCATENSATGIVTQACSDIHIGDKLKPMPVLPIPIARMGPARSVCTSPSGKTSGYIVNSKDFEYSLGVGHVIEINLGKDDFVQPGDFLTVFREHAVAGQPRTILGEVGILTSEAHTATAMIMRMRYHMTIGDQVELK